MRKVLVTLSIFMFALLLSGCGAKVASDLLVKTKRYEKPLVENSVNIEVGINPEINNYEELDEIVKESLNIALKQGNIFGMDKAHPYKINAYIVTASQAAVGFGMFEGTLEINYKVYDDKGNKILQKSINTVAGSDEWFFMASKRHRRARAVNISKNVLKFIDILEKHLEKEKGKA